MSLLPIALYGRPFLVNDLLTDKEVFDLINHLIPLARSFPTLSPQITNLSHFTLGAKCLLKPVWEDPHTGTTPNSNVPEVQAWVPEILLGI